MMQLPFSCSKCFESIASPSTFWKMDGCSHALCSECFTGFAINVKKECPCCGIIPSSITHTFFKSRGRSPNIRFCQESVTSSLIHDSESQDILTISIKDRKPATVSLDPNNQEEESRATLGLIFRKMRDFSLIVSVRQQLLLMIYQLEKTVI